MDVERKSMKLELQCMLERDDVKADKEAGLHLQSKEVIMEQKVAIKSKEKLQYESKMAKNHALTQRQISPVSPSLARWGRNLKIALQ